MDGFLGHETSTICTVSVVASDKQAILDFLRSLYSGDRSSSRGLAPQLVIAAAEVHQRAAVAVFGVERFGD